MQIETTTGNEQEYWISGEQMIIIDHRQPKIINKKGRELRVIARDTDYS